MRLVNGFLIFVLSASSTALPMRTRIRTVNSNSNTAARILDKEIDTLADIFGIDKSAEYQTTTDLPNTISKRNTIDSLQEPDILECNGHAELCNRKFSNVSMVVAHNSPFVRPHNAASNQYLPVLSQLNDGIRGLTFQTHTKPKTSDIHLCHTSCNILDVGTLESYLTTVVSWLKTHPNEVISIMMVNSNHIHPTAFIAPFTNSGMLPYVYTPSPNATTLDAWPTLDHMIRFNQRVVVTLDDGADEQKVPWLLYEFAYQWQTPFSPTDPAFPCTQDRPMDEPLHISQDKMYMLNHNLNAEVKLFGQQILLPAIPLLDQTNAAQGNGSLGESVKACTEMWGRPPKWLLVDFYNRGDFEGSVFRVAAEANGVEYEKGSCCGKEEGKGAAEGYAEGVMDRVESMDGWIEGLIQDTRKILEQG